MPLDATLQGMAVSGKLIEMQGKRMRIRGLVREVNLVHQWISDWAQQSKGGPTQGIVEEMIPIYQRLDHLVAEVEHGLGAEDAMLPDPSRRAYQWAAFMLREEILTAHSHTIARIWKRLLDERRSTRRNMRIHVRLAHAACLYRVRTDRGELRIQASEGYLHAPDEVLDALMDVSFGRTSEDARRILRRYAGTEAFRNVLHQLEISGLGLGCRQQGRYHSLLKAFTRVNEQYFQDGMHPPKLCWGSRWAVRKLGQYDPGTDRLQISPVLDQPDIPSYVIDYVMYHELLHKHLGLTWRNGRRLVHTAEFREEESKFQAKDQAQAFLQRWRPKRPSH